LNDQSAKLNKPSVSSPACPAAPRQYSRACDLVSKRWPRFAWPPSDPLDNILQHLAIQHQVSNNPLQPTIPVFLLTQSAHLPELQLAILLLPVEVGRLAGTLLSTDLRHRRAFLALFHDKRLLSVRKFDTFMPNLLAQPRKTYCGKLYAQMVQFSGGRELHDLCLM
jgi:hypothetical protein